MKRLGSFFDEIYGFDGEPPEERQYRRSAAGIYGGEPGHGDRAGYDLALTRAIADAVSIPVIASGGAGTLEHFYDALTEGGADAALVASLFHYKELEISQVKDYLSDRGISVRR